MSDLPPLPPGYALAPLPQAAPPAASVSPDIPPLPSGYSLTPPVTPAPKTVYRGAILPFNRDDQGNTHFDPSTGVLGSIGNALNLPGDVFTGKTPVLSPQGGPSPELIDRAVNMAATITPSSAALRSGDLVPGSFRTNTPPSAERLKAAAGAGYDAARASGLEINGEAVADMARGLQQSLQSDQGVIAKTAPKTFGILDELTNPPAGGTANVPGLDAARRGLSAIILDGGTEGLAARNAVRRIDDFMSSLNDSAIAPGYTGSASPQAVAQTLADARGNYAAAQRSNDITGTLDRANTGVLDRAEARAHASNSGRNLDNSIRQRVASFLQSPENLAGFSQPEIDALNAVVKGSPTQNTARFVGNLLGGGGGAGGLLTSAVGLGVGHYLAGPEGGEIGMLLGPGLGASAKGVENALARRSLNTADETIRMNSPLYQAMQAQGVSMGPAMNRNNAVLRALLPSLLAPTQQPAQQNGAPRPATASDLAKLLAGWT